MAEISGLETLEAVVDRTIKKARVGRDRYIDYLDYAIEAYRQLRLYHVQEGKKIAKMTPDSINTFSFPDDLVDIIGVGVPIDGEVYWLTRRENIITTTTLVGTTETLDSDDGEGVDVAEIGYETFAGRGGNNTQGYYVPEWNLRRVKLSNVTRTEVLLVYVSSGTNSDDTTYVPKQYSPAIEAYIMWQDAILAEGKEARAQYLFTVYNAAVNLIKESRFSITDMIDEINRYTYATPRRS